VTRRKGVAGLVPSGEQDIDAQRRLFHWPLTRWDWSAFNQLPSIDMIDEGKIIRIRADLPGVDRKNIKLDVGKDSVTIRVAEKTGSERSGKNYYYSERSSAGYYRSIPLPEEVDPGNPRARFENGTLEITLTKKNGGRRSIKID
jgi:HSP20 family protein